ncbi:MAG: excinuclease ABC subunit UvrC [Chlamydiota bacterium]
MAFDPRTLALYPDQPGVYLMKDPSSQVLYVGKAKNLRARLKQYYAESGDAREMVPYLTAQVETIDTIVALTEKDALILENNLIKRHKPKYNVLLKDDKTFVSLVLTQHKWPMLRLVRYKGKPKNDGIYFGPYTNALAARQTFDLISRLFPLRQCSDAELASRERPCLLYDIKRCIAPCVNKCTEEEYGKHVENAMRLLKGQDKEVIASLKRGMALASDALEFEKADAFLQMIHQIEHVTQVQHVDNPDAKDCDVVGLYREADAVLIALLFFREGKLIGSEHFSFHLIASNDAEILESFLLQHYKNHPSIPSEILVSCPLLEQKALGEILSESKGKKVEILTPQRGKKQDLIEMGLRNAKALFVRELDARSLKEKMLLDLQETVHLTRFPRKIECFDTSNIGGSDPVASLVCFINGEKDKGRTRLFKIKGVEKADDYTAMRQVLKRHFSREKEKGDFCDLLIVDGGKGHLNLALDVFLELGIASVDAIALTKEEARHDKGLTQEKIYLPRRKDPLLIDPRSPLLFLLQKIRDEAHRTAIEFHRKRRSKRTIRSSLDEIPGIGPVKKKRLLQRFGSIKGLAAASKEELEQVAGLSEKDIRTILAIFLQREVFMPATCAIVIPARMASTRFPNKPKALIAGRTMIERVWRIARKVPRADVFIATDDEGLKKFAEGFGANVLMTSPDCLTGTDRVAEAAKLLTQHQIFFSFQGDAVLTPPWVIEEVLKAMRADPSIQMATPAIRLTGRALADFVLSKKGGSSSGTTVVFNKNNDALYFSKALIPYICEETHPDRQIYRHIGLYAYRLDTLQKLGSLPEGPLEKSEKLEQLRALENGIPIRVVSVDYRGRTHGSVDKPEDVLFVESVIAREGELL